MGHWYAVSMTFGCTLVLLHRPSWPQIWESEFKFSLVKWKWCRYVMFEAYIHLRPLHLSKLDIQSVWAIGMMSWWRFGSPLHSYIGQIIGPKYGNYGLLVEWKWCHYHFWGWYPPWTPSQIHIRHTNYILSHCYAVSARAYGCTHTYTVTPAKLAPDSGTLVCPLWSGNNVVMSWLRLISTSNCFPNPY